MCVAAGVVSLSTRLRFMAWTDGRYTGGRVLVLGVLSGDTSIGEQREQWNSRVRSVGLGLGQGTWSVVRGGSLVEITRIFPLWLFRFGD